MSRCDTLLSHDEEDSYIHTLCSMFEAVDPEVIRLVLIEECDGNMESAVEALLVVTDGVSRSQQQDEKVKPQNDDISTNTNYPNQDISNAILIMDDLWQQTKSERERSIKLLSKIYKNIESNPNEAKYRRLNTSKILSKPGILPQFTQLLLCSGFTADANGTHYDLDDNNLSLCLAVGQMFEERVNGFDGCAKRIVECFQLLKLKLSDEKLYDLVCNKYPNEDIAHFLNDYHQLIKNMNSNRLYLRQSDAVCSQKNCPLMQRRNRYKRNENGDRKSMIGQKLRQIHILCHQYDEEQMIKNNQNYKQQIIKMKKTEYKDDDEKEAQNNKFVTDIKAASTSLNHGKYLKYSFGFKFYYHSFYKNKDVYQLGKQNGYESVPNHYHFSDMKQSTFKDWYISPKYANLKEEIAGKFLTIQQFDNETDKAMNNIQTCTGRKLRANNKFERQYDIKAGSPITAHHMLCIMLYTNYDKLQNKFSKTFRKLSMNESDEELKERHSAFVHLSRFIKEAVKCFGNNDPDITVYHGINALAIFDDFAMVFFGPTSTTTAWEVAINFATNSGTVITLESYFKDNDHFDCSLWSDFPCEEEKLFIGMDKPMYIINAHDIHKNIEYEEWIFVLTKFKNILIYDRPLNHPISNFAEKGIRFFIASVTNESVKRIPEYIKDTFDHFRMNEKKLAINLNTFSNDILWKHKDYDYVVYYGGKKLKDVYFDQNDNIKWSFIELLFPNLLGVEISNRVPSAEYPELYSYADSILLTDDLLNEVFHFLKDNLMELIQFLQPQNSVDSMKELMARFNAHYEKIGYDLGIYEGHRSRNTHAQNKCNIFRIEKRTLTTK